MNTQLSVDLNADLGEGFGAYTYGADPELLPLVTSANIACGCHAGDPGIMRRAAALARRHGVCIGAHPGYPDRAGFGRRYMELSAQEVIDGLLFQIGALDGICRAEGTMVSYVKPHGALYNAAVRNEALAAAIAGAVRAYSPALYLLCPAGSAMAQAAHAEGLPVAQEFFADRGYQDDGTLVPRKCPDAVISDPEAVCRRVVRAVRDGTVETVSGRCIPVRFESVCLHGDTPAAAALARRIRDSLLEASIALAPFAGGDAHAL